MKKLLLLFTSICALSSAFLTSCNSSNKITLVYGDKTVESYIDVSYDELKTHVENKDTFLMTVQPSNGCTCWTDFAPILTNYIKENHVIVYHLRFNDFMGKDKFNLNIKEGYTTFAIFEDGIVKQNMISDNQNMFHDQKTFKDYMNSIVNLPHFFYVSIDDVNKMYHSEEKSVIYFARSTCGDCSYADRNVLNKYAKERTTFNKNLYILDCEKLGIRQYDKDGNLTPESSIAWTAWKALYGLAELTNPTYGYSTGVVPTFFVVSGSLTTTTFHDASVFFNDTVTKEDNKYVVSESFYTTERIANLAYLNNFNGTKVLKGLELNENDVNVYQFGEESYVSWKQDKANEYHAPLLKAFLDYYL